MKEFCVTVVRTLTARACAENEEGALRQMVDLERRGEFESRFWSHYWESREPVVFAVPTASASERIFEALAALHAAKAARQDPTAVQEQHLRAARELARAAMDIIRNEEAGAAAPEVMRGAELAFRTAKIFARAAVQEKV